MIRLFLIGLCLGGITAFASERIAAVAGLDTTLSASETLQRVEPSAAWFNAAAHPWLRIRSLPDPTNSKNRDAVERERSALERLRALGFQTICLLRWDATSWTAGVRSGGGHRLALDLREAYARAEAYGRAYGRTTTAFEVENEPDISFVEENPETYAAFLKTCYSGLKEGAGEEVSSAKGQGGEVASGKEQVTRGRAGGAQRARGGWGGWVGRMWQWLWRRPQRPEEPWVVMAPLGLPPGPYLEALISNGLFSATDAFNFHFYGYAEDFSGTYRQFQNAVAEGQKAGDRKIGTGAARSMNHGAGTKDGPRLESGALNADPGAAEPPGSRRSLPVLLTEYGYGSLSDASRGTAEGRVAQWRWFRSVGEQARELGVEGLMAFCLEPYLERSAVEFGLVTPQAETGPEIAAKDGSGDVFRAGGLSYRAEDFSETDSAAKGKPPTTQPWMRAIGRRIGSDEATPALAWLLDQGHRHPYTPRNWTMTAPRLSPVVIDFVAGDGLVQLKRYTGYLALGEKASDAKGGVGDLALYNFSKATVRGRLRSLHAPELRIDGLNPEETTELAPGERRMLPLRFTLSSERFARLGWTLRFEPKASAPAAAVFTTAFYPEASGMSETVLTRFTEGIAESKQNRRQLASLPVAREEMALHDYGRWQVTPGLSVSEIADGLWRFSVKAFPGGQPRPTVAELPLRDDAVFPDGAMMRFAFRLAEPSGTTLANGRYCEAYFRTANGNLYQVWPRQYATGDWSEYTEVKENYTMAFYSRANLPWRFADNRLIALVLWFRPVTAPATYEVKDARIVELSARRPTR